MTVVADDFADALSDDDDDDNVDSVIFDNSFFDCDNISILFLIFY